VTRAGRACAAAAVALVLAPATACSVLQGPAAPRTPAPVQAAWPGCEAVGAFVDDRAPELTGAGAVPDGFTATRVVLCTTADREDAAGAEVSVELERSSADVGPLLTYLARPSERATDGPCTADGWLGPWMFLLDDAGRYVVPAIPVDRCGKPLGWSDREAEPFAWEKLAYTDRVLRTG